MTYEIAQAALFINGQRVGIVTAKGADVAWGYGDFEPEPSFARFAALFGSWSLLMHADEDMVTQSAAAAEELVAAESAIDALHAELRWLQDGKVTRIAQLNIEGRQIEWRRGF